MDASRYWKYQIVIAAAMGFLFALGFRWNNIMLVAFSFALGISFILYLRRNVEGPIYDERSSVISNKASAATFSAFTLGSLALAALIFYLGKTSNPGYLQWSFGLAYIVCALMVMRLFFWVYYSWKYGG